MSATVTLKLSPKDYKAIVLATRILLSIANYLGQTHTNKGNQTPQDLVHGQIQNIQTMLDPSRRGVDTLAFKRHILAVLQELGAE